MKYDPSEEKKRVILKYVTKFWTLYKRKRW